MTPERRAELTGDPQIARLVERVKELEEAAAPFVHGFLREPKDGIDWERAHIIVDVMGTEWNRLSKALAKKEDV